MQFKEKNEIRWTTTAESRKAHIGIPHDVEFEVRKHKGRFVLKSESNLVPAFIYPVGVEPGIAKQMEDEHFKFMN